ncbi:MAG TPA: prenyltransferase/squalene oxidase repeat-containing protein, partial [Solirubrobacteraceae bacterium]|nr:prenyltransferase/squalene oxidase repeat-containing protein [Solirubrobacteraceae bacterium]
MSWAVASFAIVFGVLIAGWLAYERSRPSARMAAVVGTLAAVAALGRDAFVAIPDVKPITAITLVVGYALGPLAGFTVGAVGMLASNIVLGQGSYTPWQMVAWGLVGLAGAALGWLSGRRIGRFGMAFACALTAMGAKEIMNVYTWTLGANHSSAALLVAAGTALPFDVTDAVASFLFGIAFGPELARLLGRMRARMDVTWEAVATPLAALVLMCGGVYAAYCPARAGGAPISRTSTSEHPALDVARLAAASSAISRGVAYLEDAQNADGGFGGARGQRSSELYSAWAAIGVAAAGRDPLALARGGHTVLSSIEAEASTLQGAGDLERTILALRACGVSAYRLGGGDPVARLLHYRAGDGSFGHLINLTSFAVLALRAAGEPAGGAVVRDAARWLARQQNRDGGFSYAVRGASSDVDDTAAALQGIVAASAPSGPVVSRAVVFLERVQG